ncbi:MULTISPECIES: Ldh family oxidoreductase [Pseudonocardia]|uniref:Ldh family oxidoreductase n=1 Tax=Pseudonocardia TaxID=1847 RepID=UPI0018D4FA8B|nr:MULTISPECIES: Ldh family oxidoreductase [Pseudonocardia]
MVAFAGRALTAVGVPDDDARLVGDSLASADRRGIASHGLLRLPLYVRTIRAGGVTARARPRWVREHGATAVLDADGGLGQVAMAVAVDRAAALAGEHGAAVVAVQGSSHYGAGAYWTERLTEQGMAGLLTSTTGASVTPFGGARPVLGTNPLTVAVPSSGDGPLAVDMATSNGAYGKVVAARDEGREIPEGWAVAADGTPTTDPAAALGGALLPFGRQKGSGLSVLLEVLAAALTSASYADETIDMWVDPGSRMNAGHLLLAVDTAAFTGRGHTEARAADMQERVRSAAPPGGTVHAPGDPERAQQARTGDRVPLAGPTLEQLDRMAADLGIEGIGEGT